MLVFLGVLSKIDHYRPTEGPKWINVIGVLYKTYLMTMCSCVSDILLIMQYSNLWFIWPLSMATVAITTKRSVFSERRILLVVCCCVSVSAKYPVTVFRNYSHTRFQLNFQGFQGQGTDIASLVISSYPIKVRERVFLKLSTFRGSVE